MKRIRIITTLLTILLIALLVTACGNNESTKLTQGLETVAGDYQAVEFDNGNDDDYIGGYWHLYIGQDEESGDCNLSIYDNEAGNPGVEGMVTELKENDDQSGAITIEIDQDYYDELPSYKWKTEDDEYLTVEYKLTKEGIELTNNGVTIQFVRDEEE